ncbi:MAG TPA: choice-of-anchor Q domain-containing protein, partial [Rhodanobacteraceae bacterium]|nr:choice-of-anchor Q domain-containing protein [Rhodanobacteraceae bacterium]
FRGLPTDWLALYSSIVAKNTAGNTPADIYLAEGVLGGADNLVIGTNFVPPPSVITVIADPKLGPLQLNGGPLPMHALLAGSPAIGRGNQDVSFPQNDANTHDERGPGYPRATGSPARVDLGAFQFDRIFFADFD